MNEVLARMGMRDAFDGELANFAKLGSLSGGNICINRIIHKTYLQVNERGTKAGASTTVEVETSPPPAPDEPKTVILNRPFVFMIIDQINNVPVFIGAILDV